MKILRSLAALCAAAMLWTVSSAADAYPDGKSRVVRVVNSSSVSIWRLYGSNVWRSSWENDILGDYTIPAGTSRVVDFDDGTGACYFDLKAVMRSGQEVVRSNVDVCSITTWTIYE